ncbi:MAG TPA: histidine triad nucleotide-binding protein [Candidatus Paceibacterota bacterium]|nr:histidine triad nucleotide-binding protein [Candidatus Paceibacterota bacterium]
MTDCVFCKIVGKEIPAEFLHEDDKIVAFKDIKPAAPVHILVVPKEHIQSVGHLENSHAEVVSKLVFTAKSLAEEAGLNGYKLVFNVGRGGGQIIDHLHLHLLGGWRGNSEKGGVAAMPESGLDK